MAVNPNLAIPLHRSKTGHLLVDLRGDWLQQGFRMDDIPPHLLLGDVPEEENFLADSVYGVFPEAASPVHRSLGSDAHPGPVQPASDNVCAPPSVLAASPVVPGDPAARRSSEMRSSLSALASLVALHFHGSAGSVIMPRRLRGRKFPEGRCSQDEGTQGFDGGARLGLGPGGTGGPSRPENPLGGSRTRERQWSQWSRDVACVPSLRAPDLVCATGRGTRFVPQGRCAAKAVAELPPNQLQDKRIGLRAAEQSALRRLEQVRRLRESIPETQIQEPAAVIVENTPGEGRPWTAIQRDLDQLAATTGNPPPP